MFFEYAIAVALQDGSYERPHAVLILDHEDRLGPDWNRGGLSRREGLGCGSGSRQVDLEDRPMVGFTVDPDVTAQLLHNPVDCGETEAGAPPALLRRKERVKNVLAHFCCHA